MFSEYDLPLAVKVGEKEFKIREKCDYRIVLKCIKALKDVNLSEETRVKCALIIFYEDYKNITNSDIKEAIEGMLNVIGYGETHNDANKPATMDWEHDFKQIAPPISRVLGYSVRDPEKYTHYWDFIGAYLEIGDCAFATIMSIRQKRMKGKKLEKYEEEFYQENRKIIELPRILTKEDEDFLNSDW